MPGDGQRGPGSGGRADRGRPGAGRARQDAGGQSPPGDGQDHVGTPRPDALIPALDEGQLAALREIGHEWDRVSADPQVWRQALPVDPALAAADRPATVKAWLNKSAPAIVRELAPVPLPAARDEPCRRYPVRAGCPQTCPVIPFGSAGRRPSAPPVSHRW